MNRFYGVLVSTMFYFSSVVLTQADEVRDFLLKQLNATDFNTISETFVDGYQSFVISDEQYLFVTKDAYSELMASVKDVERKVNSFQITSRSETADFITVNFNYNYSAKVGNANINADVEGVSVLLKTGDGYISIFDAQRE